VPAVKNQTIAAYDPRALKGNGVTYATSPMGGDHTAGNALPGRGGIDHRKKEGQIELSKNLQINTMICDILGLCIFVGPVNENVPHFATLVSAYTGEKIEGNDLQESAIQVLKYELEFNRRAGLNENSQDLPKFFREEPLLIVG
jgi:aldehyde:ferredoxin oxidoreductase